MSAAAIKALVEFPVQAFKESAQRMQMNAGLRKQQELYRPGRAHPGFGTTGLEPTFVQLTADDIKVDHESKTE